MSQPRREVAARNVEAILDAAEALILAGAPLSFSALAADAGLSRPTVYSHFRARPELVSAVMRRSLRRAAAAIESAGPTDGPPVEALARVVRSAWAELARHHEIARAVGAEVPAESMHAAHHDAIAFVEGVVTRGRSDGSLRRDLSPVWLANACVGLMHAALATVQAGQMERDAARDALTATIIELCVGPTAPAPGRAARRRLPIRTAPPAR